MLILFPLVAVIVIALIYRGDLSARALIIYGSIWIVGLALVVGLSLSPGIFAALQCALAIAMLIHVRANPDIPLR
jgi:hypothetical protein